MPRSFYIHSLPWEVAKVIGGGNASKGIREALVWGRKNLRAVMDYHPPDDINLTKGKRRNVRMTDYHCRVAKNLCIALKSNSSATRRLWAESVSRTILAMADDAQFDPVKANRIAVIKSIFLR